MFRFAGLALVLLTLACGCSKPEVVLDPTSQALEHLQEHRYDDAIRSASEAIQQSPKDAAAYLYRGRAYYYRAAMGDTHRAIEDLSQAIRLAPDSSDAYYVRALVYRELGEVDLADQDNARAREFDHVAREVFDQLPSTAKPLDLSKLKTPDTDKAKADAAATTAEIFKERATADAKTKAATKPAGGAMDAFSGDASAEVQSPVESVFNRQYRELLGQTAPGEGSALSADPPAKDAFGRPIEPTADVAPLDTSADGAAALPSTENAASSPARGAGAWGGAVPPLQSPFARQTPTGAPTGMGATSGVGSMPGMLPATRSPFPQATRGSTGYVPSVSPFGGPGGQASGAAGMSRPFSGASTPFSTPGTPVRPQNSAVRPPNPRDYLP